MVDPKEIRIRLRQNQEKFVYYIISLSVTAIGFSVYKTTGETLNWKQVYLAIAVFSWGMSVFFGLTFLRFGIIALDKTDMFLDADFKLGRITIEEHETGVSPLNKTEKKSINDVYSRAKIFFAWQQFFFYIGIITFLTWHILEMKQ